MIDTLKALFVLCILCIGQTVYAQFEGDVYRLHTKATVKVNNKDMELPWAGGLNNPQFAMADFNRDGRKDLLIYEINEYQSKVKTFVAKGNGIYEYNPLYEGNFGNVNGYVKLLDFNGDNIADLIHKNQYGVGIFYGYYNNNELKFNYYKDLYYEINTGNWSGVYVSGLAIPAFADLDGDSDIDILSYNVGGNYITYYQNCQVDDGLPRDSVKICLKNWCWGGVKQEFVRKQLLGIPPCNFVYHLTTCKGCPDPRGQHKGTDGPNTICLVDIDSDGDLDYFNGHTAFSDIQFFYNGKSQYGVDSMIKEDTVWEANGTKMYMPAYPAAYLLDIDQDGDDDLIFSPMSENTENYNCVSFYENTGTNANKNYVHKKNDFLVDRMIDMGKSSYPVLYDFDKDGKDDLFIGSDGFYQPATSRNRSKIAYYRNVSQNAGDYAFELQNDDFLGLYAQNIEGASIAIGDLDNDSLDDLVLGHSDGTFTFYKNHASSNTDVPDWKLEQSELKDAVGAVMDVVDFSAPFIYDIDADGKNDLISGNQYGDMFYYNNAGSNGSVILTLVTENLGGIKLRTPSYSNPYTVPYIGPMDDTEIDYLVVGGYNGKILRYDGFQNGAMPATYTLIDSNYSYVDAGARSAVTFGNLDGDSDNLYEMVAGNLLGGLDFYKQDFKVGINDKVKGRNDVLVYPNPANSVLNVRWTKGFANGLVQVQIVSITGQVITSKILDEQAVTAKLNIGKVSAGTYYCVVTSGANKSVQPVSILR